MRKLNEKLAEVASNPKRSVKDRDRARQQAVRARPFYGLVRLAYPHRSRRINVCSQPQSSGIEAEQQRARAAAAAAIAE
jgi:hypothetical protein